MNHQQFFMAEEFKGERGTEHTGSGLLQCALRILYGPSEGYRPPQDDNRSEILWDQNVKIPTLSPRTRQEWGTRLTYFAMR